MLAMDLVRGRIKGMDLRIFRDVSTRNLEFALATALQQCALYHAFESAASSGCVVANVAIARMCCTVKLKKKRDKVTR